MAPDGKHTLSMIMAVTVVMTEHQSKPFLFAAHLILTLIR